VWTLSAGVPIECRSPRKRGPYSMPKHTRGIGVAGDVEPAQRRWEQKGGKVIGRERGSHRHGRQRTAQRQHRLDALADSEDVVGRDKATGASDQADPRAPRLRLTSGCIRTMIADIQIIWITLPRFRAVNPSSDRNRDAKRFGQCGASRGVGISSACGQHT
jgi:hypothetical protein